MTPPRRNDAFAAEARERLDEAARLITTLRAEDGSPAAVADDLFRQLHTLKGLFASEGHEAAGSLAHAAEQLADGWRSTEDRAQAGQLLEALDLLNATLDGELPEGALAAAAARLLAGRAPQDAAPLAPYRPTEFAEPHTRVVVTISPVSAAPAARAFLALRTLARHAAVLEAHPTAAQLKEGRLPAHRLVVTLKGDHPIEALRQVLARHSELESVERDRTRPAVPAPVAAEEAMRVSVALLDRLLEFSGEVVASSIRLAGLVTGLPEPQREPMRAETERLRALARRLDLAVAAARETQAGSLVGRLQRGVRDLARRTGKELELSVTGAELALDRRVADALVEPLLHALRNAADHGIEPPEARQALGKPSAGRLTVRFEREADRLRVEVSDDGRGFDVAALKARAVGRGLVSPQDAARMDEARALQLAFTPGLSTRAEADELSGRGMGMDALLKAVEGLGGTVSLASKAGAGSRLSMSMPASLAATALMLVRAGGATWALPVSRVRQVVGARPRGPDGGVEAGRVRLAAAPLAALLGLGGDDDGPLRWVVVEREGSGAALGVDEVLGQHDAVLQPIPPPLDSIACMSGTALLPDGEPVVVLDTARLWGDAPARTRARPAIPEGLKPALQEGFAHASEALRRLLAPARATTGFPTQATVPPALARSPAAAALFDVPGREGLRVGLVATREAAAELAAELLRGRGHGLDEAAMDAFLELGNVLCSAFVNGLAARTGTTLVPSVPAFASDLAGTIVEGLSAEGAVMSMPLAWRAHRPSGALVVALDATALEGLASAAARAGRGV